jgi:hypothetical protein
MRSQPNNSGRRIPAAATVMQEQAERRWHGTREHTSTGSQAQAGISLEERAHTLSASQHTLHRQLSSSLQADTREDDDREPHQKSDRNSHVPWARLL